MKKLVLQDSFPLCFIYYNSFKIYDLRYYKLPDLSKINALKKKIISLDKIIR